MENKLYYQNAYIKSFYSKVIKQDIDQSGTAFVVLEQTAFYPTGGGQPYDTGTIDGIHVINVEEMDGEIRHYLTDSLKDVTVEVNGELDWKRRFDHMQQHAGQHILSASFESLFGYKTVSFHLGKEILTIDLDTEQLSDQEAMKAEALANQIILENRPIETKWVSEEELSQYKLRKELSVTDNIRLVMIPNFDYNGCGGTHPSDTSQVRAIKILDWERQKKKIRLQFICGDRVLEQLHQKQKTLLELTKLLNAPEQEMGAAVRRLIETGKEQEQSLVAASEALLSFEAKDTLNGAEGEVIIGKLYKNRPIQELQKLARLMMNEKDEITFLAVAENEDRLQVVCAKGSAASGNMKNVIAEILPQIDGKGGGNESFAQGGGAAVISGEQLLQNLLTAAR
ncbi:alanyl-tRNA editing protein [Neobacillus sp. K501]